MKHTRSIAALIAAFTSFSYAQAQEAVDIALHQGENGNLEVRVIPHSDFDGIFSALVFTLRWDAATEASLGAPLQSDAQMAGIAMERSGEVHQAGSSNYQVYAGFGMQRLAEAGQNWEAGKEYTVATIPVHGAGTVELVNDAWTADQYNNGDFYVSLGGQDLTGDIQKSLVNAGNEALELTVVPNPTRGAFSLSMFVPGTTNIRIELLNTLGSVVMTEQLRDFSGAYKNNVDLTGMESGVYYLKVYQGTNVTVRKVLFQ